MNIAYYSILLVIWASMSFLHYKNIDAIENSYTNFEQIILSIVMPPVIIILGTFATGIFMYSYIILFDILKKLLNGESLDWFEMCILMITMYNFMENDEY